MLAARLSLLSKFQLSTLPISLSFLLFPFLAASVYSLSICLLSDLILTTDQWYTVCLAWWQVKAKEDVHPLNHLLSAWRKGLLFFFKKYSIALIC